MQITQNDLKRAFNSSTLPRQGYTFDVAMSIHHLAICLKHLAQRKTPQAPAKPVREYWYNKI